MKHTYYYDEYYKDVSNFADRYSKVANPHVVSVYKDSLPWGIHLSNILDCGFSIVEVNNGNADWILNNTEVGNRLFPQIICIDLVYNEDVFMGIKKLPEFINNPDYSFYSVFGHHNDLNVFYGHELIYKEVNFPWQRKIVQNERTLKL